MTTARSLTRRSPQRDREKQPAEEDPRVFVKVRVRGDVVKEEVITFRVYKVHRSYVSGSECSERERERVLCFAISLTLS
jgi:hypothetical protein